MATDKQLELIERCISQDFVEVGWINGVNPRTAESLVERGVLEYDYPPFWEGSPRIGFVRIRTAKEIDSKNVKPEYHKTDTYVFRYRAGRYPETILITCGHGTGKALERLAKVVTRVEDYNLLRVEWNK